MTWRVFAAIEDETFVIVSRYPDTPLRFNGEEVYPSGPLNIVRVFGTGTIELPAGSFWDLATRQKGYYSGPPFSGNTPGYAWEGAPNESASVLVAETPYSKLLSVADAITSDNEEFQCVVRTKTLDFDSAHLYKRLFWWGLNGIFRMRMVATVTPVVYGGAVTWGQLISRGITWGQLLHGTWGRPVSTPILVETVRPELGAVAQRKFVKFMKKLRFRQIQFQAVFNTRGDDQTAPVRLFSLHAEVTPAQTVSKAIS